VWQFFSLLPVCKFERDLAAFSRYFGLRSSWQRKEPEILPHDLCIYLLFWIRFLQVTQMVRKNSRPVRYVPNHHARTIYFYMNPHVALGKERRRRKIKSECCYWPIMGRNKMFCTISILFASPFVCVYAIFSRFCGEINFNLHLSDNFMAG